MIGIFRDGHLTVITHHHHIVVMHRFCHGLGEFP